MTYLKIKPKKSLYFTRITQGNCLYSYDKIGFRIKTPYKLNDGTYIKGMQVAAIMVHLQV